MKQSIRAFWAAEVPVIPDFISRRLQRRDIDVTAAMHTALLRQRSWLARLHVDNPSTAVSLRYISYWSGEAWQVRIGFVGRIDCQNTDDLMARVREHWQSFLASFPDADYPLRPARTLHEFVQIFAPFHVQAVAEIRRHEEMATLIEAYLPSPFSEASVSDMQFLCQALLVAQSPQMVAINLRPTSLSEDERAAIASEARRLGELKQRSVQVGVQPIGYSEQTQKLFAEAELAESLYKQMTIDLRQSYEMTLLVAGSQHLSSGVLQALAAEATGSEEPQADSASLTPRAVTAHPQRLGERIAAIKNLFEVRCDGWGNLLAPQGLERLPRLFSVTQTHAVFRLPIPDEQGVYGLPCTAFDQTKEVGRRKLLRSVVAAVASEGEIDMGGHLLSRASLTRHVFVAGVPGTGKTNTCLYLLERLWNADPGERIPFLVLEPAKFEYRGLIGTPGIAESLMIFSAGDERIAPLRFNPFEVPEGISLEAHVGRLLDIFRASMAMWGPLPAILEKLIRQLYRKKGWRYVGSNQHCEAPQMSELYASIAPGIRALGYSRETEGEAIAALEVRIGRLCEGSLGKMVNARQSINFDQLMQKPAVIEIASVGNTDDRAFIMALFLNRLYQHWIVHKDQSGQGLKHVTLVEEAHNLLANASTIQIEGQANPKGEAVQQFANMLAEIRSFGEGLIIVDQSPSKLISDVVKMTGTKIAHAVVADEDRLALKSSMNLTDEQAYQLALLPCGEPVIFQVGTPSCAQVRMPSFKDYADGFALNVTDAEVRQFTAAYRLANAAGYLPTPGCSNCPVQCAHDESVDVALAMLGSHVEKQLQRELRIWWMGVVCGSTEPPPYERFEQTLQRVQKQKPDSTVLHHQAFCMMTKMSHGYLREVGEAQFYTAGEIANLHKELTHRLQTNGCLMPIADEPSSLSPGMAASHPQRPYPGCEFCVAPCSFRGEALRTMQRAGLEPAYARPTAVASVHNKAAVIASKAWEITHASDLYGRLRDQSQHLAYCIAIQLCDDLDESVDYAELSRRVKMTDLKYAGCLYCPSRCKYGNEMEITINNLSADEQARLTTLWQGRFDKSRELIVAELLELFRAFARSSLVYTEATQDEQELITFCASLHAREQLPILSDAGAKAADPSSWWGKVMAKSLGLD